MRGMGPRPPLQGQRRSSLNELVHKHRATVFPSEYFEDLIDILEERIDSLQFQELVVRSTKLPPELSDLPTKISTNWSPSVKKGVSLRELITDTVNTDAFVSAQKQTHEGKGETVTV